MSRLCSTVLTSVALLSGCGASAGLQVQRSAASTKHVLSPTTKAPAKCSSGRSAKPLGKAAYIDDSALRISVIATCRTVARTLVASDVEPPVRFSANGRFVAYGRGVVVSVEGREIVRPLGGEVLSWQWLGDSDELVGVTTGGGLVVGAPGRTLRQLLPDGWGANSVATAADGQIAVTRAVPHPDGHVHGAASIWTLTLARPQPKLAYRASSGTAELVLSRFVPGEHAVVFWVNRQASAALFDEGLPLELVRLDGSGAKARAITLSTDSPTSQSAIASCGERLVFVVGGGSEATLDKRLESADHFDGWDVGELANGLRSASSPSCSAAGRRLVAAIGPNRPWHAGDEHRSIEELGIYGSRRLRLTDPPEDDSDGAPRLTANGEWVLFVRGEYRHGRASGSGYLVSTRSPGSSPIGPLFSVGPADDYFGADDWTEMTAFYPGTG